MFGKICEDKKPNGGWSKKDNENCFETAIASASSLINGIYVAKKTLIRKILETKKNIFLFIIKNIIYPISVNVPSM